MTKIKAVTKTALLGALALLLGYVESLFPLPFFPIGVKIGLANAAMLFELYTGSAKSAWALAFVKVALCSLLFGTGVSFLYSLAGTVLSLAVMLAAKKSGAFSIVGVSAAGGIFHNAGQLICAYFFMGKEVLLSLPLLSLCGALCGALTGICARIIIKRGGELFAEK